MDSEQVSRRTQIPRYNHLLLPGAFLYHGLGVRPRNDPRHPFGPFWAISQGRSPRVFFQQPLDVWFSPKGDWLGTVKVVGETRLEGSKENSDMVVLGSFHTQAPTGILTSC